MRVSVVIPVRYEGGQRERIARWVTARWQHVARNLAEDVEIIQVDSEDEPFDRGRSRNKGVEQAGGDVLVIADADVIPDAGLIGHGIEALEENPWCLPYDVYYNLDELSTDLILDGIDPEQSVTVDPYTHEHRIVGSVAGMLIMPADAFDAAGGYDERFDGWGYEDNAFALALDTLWGAKYRVHGNLLHLWHPVPADGAFNSPRIEKNRRLYRKYTSAAKRGRGQMRALVDA